MRRRLRIAIVDDYAVVIAGLAALLAAEGIDVVEADASVPVSPDVDVVLYDAFAQVHGRSVDLEDLVGASGAPVVVYSWNLRPGLVERALAGGARGCLSKVLSGPELVSALTRVIAGETVVEVGDRDPGEVGGGDGQGRPAPLSSREAEILVLIAEGLTNQEIAARAFLGVNTVKSHIRTAYRKIGVSSRSQAVLWGVDHRFEPDLFRSVDPALLPSPPADELSGDTS